MTPRRGLGLRGGEPGPGGEMLPIGKFQPSAAAIPGRRMTKMSGSSVKVNIGFAALGASVAAGGLLMTGSPPGIGQIAWHALAGLVVAAVPLLVLRQRVFTPLHELRETIEAMKHDGDLSRRAPVSGGGDLAATAQTFNDLIRSIQGIIGKVCYNSIQVTEVASQLIAEAKNVSGGSEQQKSAAQATMHAMEEMNVGINQVAENAELSSHNAQSARELSKRGADIVDRASAEIERIAKSVEQSAQVVAALGERSQAISGIVRVIHDIADQTNLLALNAAIEAARAGEQGRGFAVVADEVRKLAERTTAATAEIGAMIGAIQKETQSAISSIQQGSTQARSGAELARQAADSLHEINKGAQETMEKVEAIATAIQQQSANGHNITGHMQDILKMTEANSATATRALAEAGQLDVMAINLKEVGSVFRLGERGERSMATHARMPAIVMQAAKDMSRVLEGAVRSGAVRVEDLFDQNYVPIPNTRPQKFHSKFDAFTDNACMPLQEALIEKNEEMTYAIGCDLSGYVPTHNQRFSKPLTGDEKVDFVNNRTKRIFGDPVGKKCGAHEYPFLVQTYRRDTGEIMHDISAPVYVNGRHWGGFRIGYRTE
jgi:methyl-accepting chemotaxis protein